MTKYQLGFVAGFHYVYDIPNWRFHISKYNAAMFYIKNTKEYITSFVLLQNSCARCHLESYYLLQKIKGIIKKRNNFPRAHRWRNIITTLAIDFSPHYTSLNLLHHEALGRAPGLHLTPDIAVASSWQLNFSQLASSPVTWDGDVSITWHIN